MTIKSTVDRNITKLEDQLVLWGAKIEELAAKMKVAGQETKIEARQHVEEAKTKLELARSKIDEAKAAGDQRWENFKDGIESSWRDLEQAFHKLVH